MNTNRNMNVGQYSDPFERQVITQRADHIESEHYIGLSKRGMRDTGSFMIK